ncbi:hypothetical protein PR202_ga12388 [Eleusine coracana subsp. coracana]|uniref:Uncharacterized protein n=1 Tax=Eleusine coracana subsp. coracana TaxID=191504 RepID=A0AAV5CBU4_ELECO|nr:hypothetical protein PR202_ga12388 [Eleusine coracana subsp. coracana]
MPHSFQMAIQLTLILISCSLYNMYSPSSSSASSSLPASSSLALLILVISTCISLLFSNIRHLLKAHGHKAQITSPSMDEVPEEKSIVLQDEVPEDAAEDSMESILQSSDCTANGGERAEEDSGSEDYDDDSLIEISLDDGHYVGVGQRVQCAFKEKDLLAEFLPDLVLDKRDFVDILSEISEEDSLIEIDIARGSIKCSNFGIKA